MTSRHVSGPSIYPVDIFICLLNYGLLNTGLAVYSSLVNQIITFRKRMC